MPPRVMTFLPRGRGDFDLLIDILNKCRSQMLVGDGITNSRLDTGVTACIDHPITVLTDIASEGRWLPEPSRFLGQP